MKTAIIIPLVLLLLATLHTSAESRTRQKRAWIIDSFRIEEEHPGPFPYVLGIIRLEPQYRKAMKLSLSGEGIDKEPRGLLAIEDDGTVLVKKSVDYESLNIKYLEITFEALNRSNADEVSTRLAVIINVDDINDHAPQFTNQPYKANIKESTTQGTSVASFTAGDNDKKDTNNSTFDFRIISVTPNTPNAEFYIMKQEKTGEISKNQQKGVISFKGCLDYEKAEKYTIVVEAKDRGEVVRLSSSSTVIVHVQDKNNHLPIITGHTGVGRVKERESGVSPLRLHATDKDKNGTAAWKAKYAVHGDAAEHFTIETDPETNDGVLTVIKPLDFEMGAQRRLSISVENEEPYFSCQVKRKTATGLWQVTNDGGKAAAPTTVNITIDVEDVNDPPEFTPAVREVWVRENVKAGHLLETFTATDRDSSFSSELVYVKGHDPGGWVNVDRTTGQITTAKNLDRESVHVVNSTYIVTIYAEDKGVPPCKSTARLIIHLVDENDNVPLLSKNTVDMCLSEEITSASISAYDLDEEPNSGPFKFELLGDVEGKWSLDPERGTTVNLVKQGTVYSGHHELQVRIYDMQGQFSVQNLTVTVCDCATNPNCWLNRGSSTSGTGSSAVLIIIVLLLVFLGCLLTACSVSFKKIMVPMEPSSDVLLACNHEEPGTDCMVTSVVQDVPPTTPSQQTRDRYDGRQTQLVVGPQFLQEFSQQHCKTKWLCEYQDTSFSKTDISRNYQSGQDFFCINNFVHTMLEKRLGSIQAPGQELCDYDPKPYAYEGDLESEPNLDAISFDESNFELDNLDLGPRFLKLATICSLSTDLHQELYTQG